MYNQYAGGISSLTCLDYIVAGVSALPVSIGRFPSTPLTAPDRKQAMVNYVEMPHNMSLNLTRGDNAPLAG